MTSVCIHPNSGPDVGLGHLVRCLSLAAALDRQDISVTILLEPDGTGAERSRAAGFEPVVRETDESLEDAISAIDADIAVIDSYDVSGETLIRLDAITRTVVIDDLGDRTLNADLVVNNNIYADAISYSGARRTLRGPRYCMLRDEFRDIQSVATEVPHVLVTLGGSDLVDSFEETLVTVLETLPRSHVVDAIIGPYFTTVDLADESIVLHQNPDNFSKLMAHSLFAVTGGGQTMYELAACGTPAIAVEVGPDQHRNIAGLADEEFCIPVGRPSDQGFPDAIVDAVETLLEDPARRERMAATGRRLVDGRGAERVASALLNLAADATTSSSV